MARPAPASLPCQGHAPGPGFGARTSGRPAAPRRAAAAARAALLPLLLALGATFLGALGVGIGPRHRPPVARAQVVPPGRYVDLVFDRVTRTEGIVYGQATDIPSGRSVDLRLDLYEPAGDAAASRPVFVFLFGGGFVAGDRVREPRAYCELMARRGYVAVAIDYRINQGDLVRDGIPAAVSDARHAVAWLREHAGAHRLDAERIVIGGSSAGAITSLFTAYTDMARGAGDDSAVAAVLDLWGGLYTSVGELSADEPPLAIVHGTNDNVVPFAEAQRLRDRAASVGVPHLFHPIEGAGHAPYMPAELMAVVAPFFFERLWPDGLAPTPTDVPATATAVDPTATVPPTAPPDPPTATAPPVVETPVVGAAGRVFVPVAARP